MQRKAAVTVCLVFVWFAGALATKQATTKPTIGLCDSTVRRHVLTKPQTFSVFTYNYDLSENVYSGRVYPHNIFCDPMSIEVDRAYPSVKLEITVNSERDVADFRVITFQTFDYLSGLGYRNGTLILENRVLQLSWSSLSSNPFPEAIKLGFVAKVSASFEAPNTRSSPTNGLVDSFFYYHNVDTPQIFSVYTYDFDLSQNLSLARYLESGQNSTVTSLNVNREFRNIKLEITVNCERGKGHLVIKALGYENRFSGDGYRRHTLILQGPFVYLDWQNDDNLSQLGFVVKAYGTNEPSSQGTLPTLGVCDSAFETHEFLDSQTFSVYSYEFDLSQNDTRSRDYEPNSDCSAMYAYVGPRYSNMKIELTLNSEFNSGVLLLKAATSAYLSGLGFHNQTVIVPRQPMTLSWVNYANTKQKLGFVLKVTGTFDRVTREQAMPTLGLCDTLTNDHQLGNPQTFSVYSYKFDLSGAVDSSLPYGFNQRCEFTYEVRNNQFPNIKVELILNSRPGEASLAVLGADYRNEFSGLGFRKHTFVIAGPVLSLTWSNTALNSEKLGVVAKISGTNERPSETFEPTVGLCDSVFDTYRLDGPQTFSVYSYNFDLSTNVDAARNYGANQTCTRMFIDANRFSHIQFNITVNSASEEAVLVVKNARREFAYFGLGYGEHSIILADNWAHLIWTNNGSSTEKLGFFVTVTGLLNPNQ